MIQREPAKVLERIKSSAVTIAPSRLKRVATYQFPTAQFKTLARVADFGPENISEHVWLAAARCAWTGAA